MKSPVHHLALFLGAAALASAATLQVGSGQTYATIQAAVNASAAGDIINIHAGTYRETVTVTRNNLTIQANANDTVSISGYDIITGWTREGTSNIWFATVNNHLGHETAVWANGQNLTSARWPNQTGTYANWSAATADVGTNATTIADGALPGANGAWVGARVYIIAGNAWQGWSSRITAYDAAAKKLTIGGFSLWANPASYYIPAPGDAYYLFDHKGLLDTAGEFWLDEANNKLFAWMPGSIDPNTTTVLVRRRLVGMNLSGRSGVTVRGITLAAATVVTDAASSGCTFDDLVCTRMGTAQRYDKEGGDFTDEARNAGFVLAGTGHTLKSSTLQESSSSLLRVSGSDHRIFNNLFQNGNTLVLIEPGMVNLTGRRILFSHNTVAESAGRLLFHRIAESAIQYNEVFNGAYHSDDLGLIYTANSHGENTSVCYNILHDNHADDRGILLYFDNQTHAFIAHHNLLYRSLSATNARTLHFGGPSNYNLVYNNTTFSPSNVSMNSLMGGFTSDWWGCRAANNIVTGGIQTTADTVTQNNFTSGNPLFVNSGAGDFRLQSGSPCINAGIALAGITDGFLGTAPDQGAIESGGADWTVNVGHNFASPPNPSIPSVATVLYRNRVKNGGIEFGTFEGWTKSDAQLGTVVADNAWGDPAALSRTNFYGARLGGAVGKDGLTQVVTGLTANTPYRFTIWIKSAAGQAGTVGVTAFGGTDTWASSTATGWTEKQIAFTTGATSTSATIRVTTTGTGFVYFDDAGLQRQ